MASLGWQQVWHGMPPELRAIINSAIKCPRAPQSYSKETYAFTEAQKAFEEETQKYWKEVVRRADNYYKKCRWLNKQGKLSDETFEKIDWYIYERIKKVWLAAKTVQKGAIAVHKVMRNIKCILEASLINLDPKTKKLRSDFAGLWERNKEELNLLWQGKEGFLDKVAEACKVIRPRAKLGSCTDVNWYIPHNLRPWIAHTIRLYNLKW